MILNVANNANLEEQDLLLFQKTDLIMDTSGRNIINLGQMLQSFGKDKFAFGSHAPILDHYTGLLRVESLRKEEADEKTKEQLRSGNIKRLLNL